MSPNCVIVGVPGHPPWPNWRRSLKGTIEGGSSRSRANRIADWPASRFCSGRASFASRAPLRHSALVQSHAPSGARQGVLHRSADPRLTSVGT